MIDLNTLASSALVLIYNDLARQAATPEMPLGPVKKFSDKPTAVKRITNLLADYNKARTEAGVAPLTVNAEGKLDIDVPEQTGLDTETAELRDAGALDASVTGGTVEDLKADLSTDKAPEVPAEKPPASTPKASVAPKAPKVREPKNPGGRPALVGLTDIITLIHTADNPKRAEAARRFAKYKDGMTVQAYIDAVGNRRQALRDIAWDMRMKWISISGAPRVKKVSDEAAPEVTPEVAPEQVEAAADAAPEATAEQTDQAA